MAFRVQRWISGVAKRDDIGAFALNNGMQDEESLALILAGASVGNSHPALERLHPGAADPLLSAWLYANQFDVEDPQKALGFFKTLKVWAEGGFPIVSVGVRVRLGGNGTAR